MEHTKNECSAEMTLLTPARDWRNALPLGDGSIGALVYGGISPETILFNHDSLWYGPEPKAPCDYSKDFHLVREMGFSGDIKGANDYIASRMRKDGATGCQTYHPAFDLKIRSAQRDGFSDYRRTLDFSTGEAKVSWKDGERSFERRFFVSRTRHLSFLKIKVSGGASEHGFQLCEHNLYDMLDMQGNLPKCPLTFSTRAEGDKLFINVKGSFGGDYGAVMKIFPNGGTLRTGVEPTWTEQMSSIPMLWELPLEKRDVIYVSGTDEICASLAIYVNTSDPEKASGDAAKLLDVTGGDYDALFAEHVALHGDIFNRVKLNIETEHEYKGEPSNEMLLLDAYQGKASSQLLTRLFYYGRYLLMTSSGEGSMPPTLQGNFNGDYFPAWNSMYVHNENTEMFYWQALSGRMPEVTHALYSFFEERIEDYRLNAHNLFGCRGIFIPLVSDAFSGYMRDAAPHELSFTGVAAWLSAHFYDYYLFTGDKAFLTEHALPFMEETALFYEDYLILDSDGKYTVFPSNSPENAPSNTFPPDTDLNIVMNPGIPTTFNSTIDIALIRELLTNLISAYDCLGIKPDKRAQYAEMLGKLRDFRINEDGALAEWVCEKHTDNYAHRHLSHIYPLFPGFQITEEKQPELFDAVKVAVGKRLGIGLASQTGWSLVHLANIYARLHDGNAAAHCFDLLSRSCVGNNLFTYHNDCRNMGLTLSIIFGRSNPYQIDANMGFTSAVTEMLLCSTPDNELRITPALPDGWLSGSISRLGTRCGCEADIEWNRAEGSITATLYAADDRKLTVILPMGWNSQGNRVFELDIVKGNSYTIKAFRD